MKKYDAAPHGEMSGFGTVALFENMEKEAVRPILEANMKKHSIEKFDVNGWYPVQFMLDFLKALEDQPEGMFNLVAIGMAIMTEMPFPPEVTTIPEAVYGISAIYNQAFRNYFKGE